MNLPIGPDGTPLRKRRVRYKGKNPRRFEEKYKELDPEKYAKDVEKIVKSGKTPAGTHRPILVKEILEVLAPKPGETGLDCTLGFGGHTEELLRRVMPGGRIFGIDVDPVELVRAEVRLRGMGFTDKELIVRQINFAGIHKLLPDSGGGFDLILADLGVSSMQLDNPVRGFTFKWEGPLDLRFNPQRGKPASGLIKTVPEKTLEKILLINSDEPRARTIARAIYKDRDKIGTTKALADVIKQALSSSVPAGCKDEMTKSIRRVFQALRIEVNDEFSALDRLLTDLPLCLKPKGRAAILSFHSGEDNRVAEAFLEGSASGAYSDISREPIRPTRQECFDNPRSKSAVLRWAIRSELS